MFPLIVLRRWFWCCSRFVWFSGDTSQSRFSFFNVCFKLHLHSFCSVNYYCDYLTKRKEGARRCTCSSFNIWAASWQNQQNDCAPSEDSDQPGHRPVWSESSLCAQWVAKDPSFLHADSEDSDQTGRMPRLIWVFAGLTLTLLVLSWGGSYVCCLPFYCSSSWFRRRAVIFKDMQHTQFSKK